MIFGSTIERLSLTVHAVMMIAQMSFRLDVKKCIKSIMSHQSTSISRPSLYVVWYKSLKWTLF